MPRTRHFRDLMAWQKAMELARAVYLQTEEFPKSETFGLRMQMRRSAVSVASHIAEGHGRLTDPELRKSLGLARGSLYEFETQNELACDLEFINKGIVPGSYWIWPPKPPNSSMACWAFLNNEGPVRNPLTC
jgi:four helix bundle protein